MSRVIWVMRDGSPGVERKTRNGARVSVTLICGHALDYKASRYRLESRKFAGRARRYRCDECTAIYHDFLDPLKCFAIVRSLENDKPTIERPARDTHAGRRRYLHGQLPEAISRRFLEVK